MFWINFPTIFTFYFLYIIFSLFMNCLFTAFVLVDDVRVQ